MLWLYSELRCPSKDLRLELPTKDLHKERSNSNVEKLKQCEVPTWVFVLADDDDFTVSKDHFNLDQVVNAESAKPAQEAESAKNHDRGADGMSSAATMASNERKEVIKRDMLTKGHDKVSPHHYLRRNVLREGAGPYKYQSPSVVFQHQM